MAFEGCSGAVKSVPQSGSKLPELRAEALETVRTGDLVWAFFDEAKTGEKFSKTQTPEVLFPHLKSQNSKPYFSRDLPYSFDMLVENFMDPAHIPFAHHSLQGTRADGCEIPMSILAKNESHVEVKFKDLVRKKPRTGVVSFQRPVSRVESFSRSEACQVRYHFRTTKDDESLPEEKKNYTTNLEIFCVPVREGHSRVFFKSFMPKFVPAWLAHGASNRFLNTDVWLHDAEIELRKEDDSAPTRDFRAYRQVTSADVGPVAFRNWWRDSGMALSPRHSFGPALSAPVRLSHRRDLVDAWRWHTKSCAKCRSALVNAKRTRTAGLAMALACVAIFQTSVPRICGLSVGLAVAFCADRAAKIIRGTVDPAELDDRSVAATTPDKQ